MNKIIRIVENGIEKEQTAKKIKKVKLDKQISKSKYDQIIADKLRGQKNGNV